MVPQKYAKAQSRAQRLYSLDGISGKTSSGTSYGYVTRRALRPGGTLWVTGTHHIIFSLGLALHRLGTASVMSNLGRSLYGEASTIH